MNIKKKETLEFNIFYIIMTTRGIRRKKSSLSEVKVAVVGYSGVGKSGMHDYCACE